MPEPTDPRQAVIAVVTELLETQGYDAVRVREVSRRSRVSSKTIYSLFETREHLIVAAIEQWEAANVYDKVAMPEPDESLYDVMMRFLRAQFEPWERYPLMLEAYYRAQLGAAGKRLARQGRTVARRVVDTFTFDDPEFARDLEETMRNVSAGLVSRFVHGEITVDEIVPRLEIAARQLTTAERIAP